MVEMKKNMIISLENEGNVIEGHENLLNHATSYYNDLFGPIAYSSCMLDPELWRDAMNVTEEDNNQLCKASSESEIKEPLF